MVSVPRRGTNRDDFDFAVAHMVAYGSAAGAVEFPAVTLAENGVQFTLHSLSPVAMSWVERDKPTPTPVPATQPTAAPADTEPAPTAAPTAQPTPKPEDDNAYYTCHDCGHHDWTAVDGGYKCDYCGHVEAKDLSAYNNVKGSSKPAANATAPAATQTVSSIPATSDKMSLGLIAPLLVISAAALVGLAVYRKKH